MRPSVSQVKYAESLAQAWRDHMRPRGKNAPTVISTFAGRGGSSLGFSMAGFRELLAVEWDEHAVETLRVNFPHVPVFHGDIGKLTVDRCLELACIKRGELDVFDGSPPCQGFSTSGKRKLNDPRNQLFRHFVRLLRGLRPRAFVMENVAGMVKGKMRVMFAEILRELEGCGYTVAVRVLNAKYFGVPQSRQRTIFIGVRNDLGIAPSHPAGFAWPVTVWQAIGDLGDVQDPARGHVWIDESPAGRDTKTWYKARRVKQGQRFANQKRRGRWDRPADTLTTGGIVGSPYLRSIGAHPQFTRTYSGLEYRRLGSFPEPFKFPGELGNVIRGVGNSVPPLFMRAIASHIRKEILDKIKI